MSTRSDPPKKVRLACRRCRVRRIKCDDQVPACTNCAKVGAVCLDVDSQNSDVLIPRNFINAAKARIEWLEGIIRSRLPDVDLESGPPIGTTCDLQNNALNSQTLEDADSVTPLPANENTSSVSVASSQAPQRASLKRPLPASAATDHAEQFSEKAHSVAMNLGMLSLNSDSSQKHYIGSSSGLLFTHLIGVSPSSNDSPNGTEESRTRPEWNAVEATDDFVAQHYRSLHVLLRQEFPKRADAEILLQTYIRWIHPDYCILDPASLYSAVDLIYSSMSCPLDGDPLHNGWPGPLDSFYWNGRQIVLKSSKSDTISMPVIAFILFMVFSISSIVKARSRVYEFPPEKYYQAALTFSKDCFSRISPDTIQALVTIIIHGMLTPTPTNIWTLTHIGMAHCIELGLHREHAMVVVDEEVYQQVTRSIFWTLYSLDRTISTIQGRPLGFRDETFDVHIPETPDVMRVPTMPVPHQFIEAVTLYASYQFELDQIISDIKLHLYHLPGEHIRFPWPSDSISDQSRIRSRLGDWWAKTSASEFSLDRRQEETWHLKLQIKYHTTMLLLFQPSQVIRKPNKESLQICFDSASQILQDYQILHDNHALYHGWKTVQNIFAAGASMIYSFWTSSEVRQGVSPVQLSKSLRTCSTLLSIGGEWWPSVKKGYNSFGSIADLTVQKMYMEDMPSKHMRLTSSQSSKRVRNNQQQITAGLQEPDTQEDISPLAFEDGQTLGADVNLAYQLQGQTQWNMQSTPSDLLSPMHLAPEISEFLAEFDRSDSWNLLNDTGHSYTQPDFFWG